MFLDDCEKSSCCGCKACSAVCPKDAISFYFDSEGFWYPKIDNEKCIHCNKCRKVCPVSKPSLDPLEDRNQVYAAYSKDSSVLESSTSGGIFTHISDYFLENHGVIFGHKYNSKMQCVCGKAQTQEERNLFRGSKYVQSDMGEIYLKIKKETETGRPILFSGTPCQVDAVKNYFGQNVPENLFLLEIVCHGVPSPKIFAEYLSLIEKKNGKKIRGFKFRGKEKGWITPLRVISFEDGSSCGELLNADAFNNLFQGTDCILRPSCYKCRYAGKERISDISIADFWGIENVDKSMFNENRGTSLVLVNTDKGIALFDYASNFMETKQLPLSSATPRNFPLSRPSVPYKKRKEFFESYRKYGLERSMKKYCFAEERSLKRRLIRLGKILLGKKNVDKVKRLLRKQ